jgi:hypothetical protein
LGIGDWGHGWLTDGCLTGRLPGRLPRSGIPTRRHTTDWAVGGHGSWMPNNCVSSSPGWLTLPIAWGGPTCLAPRSPPCPLCHRPLSRLARTARTARTASFPFLRLHDFTLPVRRPPPGGMPDYLVIAMQLRPADSGPKDRGTSSLFQPYSTRPGVRPRSLRQTSRSF